MVALVVATALLSACGAGDGPVVAPRVVGPGSLSIEDVGPPVPNVAVSLTGRIGVRNDGDALRLSVDELERLRRVELELFDPFREEHFLYEGVLVDDLLAFADAASGAAQLHMVALDDYSVTLDIDVLRDDFAVLATRENGSHIEVAAGGPVRLVFPDGAATGSNPGLWIWSIRDIDVR